MRPLTLARGPPLRLPARPPPGGGQTGLGWRSGRRTGGQEAETALERGLRGRTHGAPEIPSARFPLKAGSGPSGTALPCAPLGSSVLAFGSRARALSCAPFAAASVSAWCLCFLASSGPFAALSREALCSPCSHPSCRHPTERMAGGCGASQADGSRGPTPRTLAAVGLGHQATHKAVTVHLAFFHTTQPSGKGKLLSFACLQTKQIGA